MRFDIVRPEYPRPDFIRGEWLNLNGLWQFEIDLTESGEEKGWYSGKEFFRKILVPFPPESKFSGIENKDFMNCVWYRRCFRIPSKWNRKRVIIHFGAADFYSKIWMNGKFLGSHIGAYTSFSFDITPVSTMDLSVAD